MELTSDLERRVRADPAPAPRGAGVLERIARRAMLVATSNLARGAPASAAPGDPRGRAVAAVVAGARIALETVDEIELQRRLDGGDPRDAGFRHEGAAMGCALVDVLTRARLRRWTALRAACGSRHDYLLHVGLGLALARLRRGAELPVPGADPLLGALAIDGAGFHAGYFRARAALLGARAPRASDAPARRIRDQGLGRSLWFTVGTDAGALGAAIDGCAESRRADLWSGVGLAAAYAGGAGSDGLRRLRDRAGEHVEHLAQGVAFAAEARVRAGNVTDATEEACRIVGAGGAVATAEVVRACRVRATGRADGSAYEDWRRQVRAQLRRGACPA